MIQRDVALTPVTLAAALTAPVIRGGETAELVPGGVVLLKTGEKVPASCTSCPSWRPWAEAS